MVEMSRHQDRARSLARFQKQERLEKENRLLVQLENNRKLLLGRLKSGPGPGQSSAGSLTSSGSSQSSTSQASWAPRSRKGRDKGSPLEPIENFPKGSDHKERLSKSTDRFDKSKFTANKNNSTRKFKSQSPSKKISVQVQDPSKVSNKRKPGGKQEYQHRNPPTELSREKCEKARARPAGHYLTTNKTKTARSAGAKFAPKPGLVQCGLCSRSFAKERIEVHGKICKKTANKKRKPFDSVKVR